MNAVIEARKLEFRGNAPEYFRIWVVNLLLSIVTLGVYSAWAKVRKKKYFYRNTRLDGHNVDYHANPVAILKGRLIAVPVFVLYLVSGYFLPGAEFAILLLVVLLLPWGSCSSRPALRPRCRTICASCFRRSSNTRRTIIGFGLNSGRARRSDRASD